MELKPATAEAKPVGLAVLHVFRVMGDVVDCQEAASDGSRIGSFGG
jgi:hypothetical protein